MTADSQMETIDAFHRLYYDSGPQTWHDTKWLGVRVLKCPLDLWVYQELLTELRPDWVVECGTFDGGSAYYLATVMDLLGKGRVVTIDVEERPGRPKHHRIKYLLGSSTDAVMWRRIRSMIKPRHTTMVILDSDHTRDHVLDELRLYSQLVQPGGYLIVEDGNINGHPVLPDFGPGPMEAVTTFLEENQTFDIDRTREKFMLTFNPRGFLRRQQ